MQVNRFGARMKSSVFFYKVTLCVSKKYIVTKPLTHASKNVGQVRHVMLKGH